MREVVEPTIILVLAWCLGDIVDQLQTGRYLSQLIGTDLNPMYLPTIVMLVAYIMSYATGTSFGSMGILFPLVIPIACQLTDDDNLRMQTAAAVMGGCVFGNLASPIADTMILSSIATACDLNAHIKTQFPYVLLVGFTSVLFCTLPVAMGAFPVYVGLLLSSGFLLAVLLVFGATDSESDSLFDRVVCTHILGRSRKIRYRSLSTSAHFADNTLDNPTRSGEGFWGLLKGRFQRRKSERFDAIN